MKKSELIFTVILIPIDFLMIFLAGLCAYLLRFKTAFAEVRPGVFIWSFQEYFGLVVGTAIFLIIIFALGGLYQIKEIRRKFFDQLVRIFMACSTGVMFLVIYIFFYREFFTSRFIILTGWILVIIFIALARLIICLIQRGLFKKGFGIHRIVIIGQDKTAEIISRELYKNPRLGYKIVERFKNFNEQVKSQLLEIKKTLGLDEIIQADPNLPQEEVRGLFDFCQEHHLVFKHAADLFGTQTSNIEIDTIDGVPIIEIKKTPLDGWGKILKRIFDIIISLVLIILSSPLLLLTAIAIKIDFKGPILFKKLDDGSPLKRVGEQGKLFNYFKFRTMRPKTDSLRYTELSDQNLRKESPLVKIKDDPRITRVGKFIRRFSIDELPELFLVFMGRMSLVGPRPHLPEEVAQYKKHHRKLLTLKPGMTGLAQIFGRSDLDFEDEVRLDTYYIENWSLGLDLQILLKTPWAVLKRRKTL
jgi:exopolysaccharide biosynthesis polyprenyl glycosylphosphotransferase